ncbi:MAG: ABC transporter ATP-binding protein [Candidatus Binatia bacterium]
MSSELACRGIRKSFGAVRAVHDLSFEVHRGEVFGIAGPNGAGKTTLFNVISGHVVHDAGNISLRDREIGRLAANERFRLGVARTFQIPQVFDTQSVFANVMVGAQFGGKTRRLSLKFTSEAIQRAYSALALVDLNMPIDTKADALTAFDKKRLMIASAIAANPVVLMLDEPFGGLNRSEMNVIDETVRTLNAQGTTIVLIEHVLSALFALSHRVMVMHHGEKIFLGAPEDVLKDERVVGSYLGDRLPEKKGAHQASLP